jgi:predicted O-methyltransferase YrrM
MRRLSSSDAMTIHLNNLIDSVMPFSHSSRDALATLYSLVQIVSCQFKVRACEIGSANGASAFIICHAIKDTRNLPPEPWLTCIDDFSLGSEAARECFKKNTAFAGSQIKLIAAPSDQARR